MCRGSVQNWLEPHSKANNMALVPQVKYHVWNRSRIVPTLFEPLNRVITKYESQPKFSLLENYW